MSRLTKFVIVLIASMAISACGGSSPSAPSAVATPTPTPSIKINVEVATKSLVRYTCSGTSGFSWRFEVYYVGPNLYNRAPSQDPMVLSGGGCGVASMYPIGENVNATSVVFRAINPDAPIYELSVELK